MSLVVLFSLPLVLSYYSKELDLAVKAGRLPASDCQNCSGEEAPVISKQMEDQLKLMAKKLRYRKATTDKRDFIVQHLLQKDLSCIRERPVYRNYRPSMREYTDKQEYAFARYNQAFEKTQPKTLKLPNKEKVTQEELLAIDALARTLYGEMQSCENRDGDREFRPDYAQAVARTIVNRGEYCLQQPGSCRWARGESIAINLAEVIPRVIGLPGQYFNWRAKDKSFPKTVCPDVDDPTRERFIRIATDAILNTKVFKEKTKTVGSDAYHFLSLNAVDEGKGLPLAQRARKAAPEGTQLVEGIKIGETKIEDYLCLAVYRTKKKITHPKGD